ncbi:MAG: hypothetical protein AAFY19_02860 [Pseudomonadota bacterium]
MARTKPLARTFGTSLGFAAALSLSSPAFAADVPLAPASAGLTSSPLALTGPFSSSTYDADADVSEWRRCGWYGCYRRGWRGGWRGGWRRHRGISTGEVIAGAVIIGGIAAIAANANNRRRQPDVVVVDRQVRDAPNYNNTRQSNPRSTGGSGIDNAVNQCLTAIERDVRVDSVDGATRVSRGWVVTGSVFDGSGFTCEIGNDGRISNINYGGFRGSDARGNVAPSATRFGAQAGTQASGQWSDDAYANARASMSGSASQPVASVERFASADIPDGEPLVPLTSDRMPAYPGGPVPGE